MPNLHRKWPLLLVLAIIVLCCGGPYLLFRPLASRVRHSLESVNHENPLLEHAIEEAKKGLPLFNARLAKPQPHDRFAIKGRFTSKLGAEYLWLKDPIHLSDGYVAVVDEQPVLDKKLKRGAPTVVPLADVVDWLIQRSDGKRIGGFTDLALSAHPK